MNIIKKNKMKNLIILIVFIVFFSLISNIGCKESEVKNGYDINGEWTFFLSFNSGLKKNQILEFTGTEESGNVMIDEATVGTYKVISVEIDNETTYNVEIYINKGDSYKYFFLGQFNNEIEMTGAISLIENDTELFGSWSAER